VSAESVRDITPAQTRATVYFDGACPLCTREIDFYRAQPGASSVHFVDISVEASPAATHVADDLTRRDAMQRFHVRDANGQLRGGAAAFATLWLALPRLRTCGKLMQHPWVLPFAEAAYRIFLSLRPFMQWCARRMHKRTLA
jgi:predicted DCC family thiol-disulfide oxidoreductase YuxK